MNSRKLVEESRNVGTNHEETLRLVARALRDVKYGEIVIKMQGGKPVWVDKHERERVG